MSSFVSCLYESGGKGMGENFRDSSQWTCAARDGSHAVDATRGHLTSTSVVSGPSTNRFGPNGLEIQKETTHGIVRWPRVT
jgi:hypothetical protein